MIDSQNAVSVDLLLWMKSSGKGHALAHTSLAIWQWNHPLHTKTILQLNCQLCNTVIPKHSCYVFHKIASVAYVRPCQQRHAGANEGCCSTISRTGPLPWHSINWQSLINVLDHITIVYAALCDQTCDAVSIILVFREAVTQWQKTHLQQRISKQSDPKTYLSWCMAFRRKMLECRRVRCLNVST